MAGRSDVQPNDSKSHQQRLRYGRPDTGPVTPSPSVPHARAIHPPGCRNGVSVASSRCALPVDGGHTASATTSVSHDPRSSVCSPATGCPSSLTWTRRPGYRCESRGSCAKRNRHRVSWCMLILRSWIVSPTAAGIACSAARSGSATMANVAGDTRTSITLSMTTRASRTPKSLPMSGKRPQPGFGSAPAASSPRPE